MVGGFWLCLVPDFTPSWGTGLRCGVLKRCNRILQVSRAPGSESCSLQAEVKLRYIRLEFSFFTSHNWGSLFCLFVVVGKATHATTSKSYISNLNLIQDRLLISQGEVLIFNGAVCRERGSENKAFLPQARPAGIWHVY